MTNRASDTEWKLLDDFDIVAVRSLHLAENMDFVPTNFRFDVAYDELFDRCEIGGVACEIAADLTQRALSGRLAYVVPGLGWTGDDSVAALQNANRATKMAVPPYHLFNEPSIRVVDALSLACAEQQAPFDAGSVPIESAETLLVSNWHGETVIELASRRLQRVYGSQLGMPDEWGNLDLRARAPLDAGTSLAALQHIYARLRRPDGCPWDREQTELSILPHVAEEADELREALERGDWKHAAEELGDVLGNVLMIAQIAHEHDHFDFEDAVAAVSAKLIRRHPHVFGDQHAANADEVLAIWNQAKAAERQATSDADTLG